MEMLLNDSRGKVIIGPARRADSGGDIICNSFVQSEVGQNNQHSMMKLSSFWQIKMEIFV